MSSRHTGPALAPLAIAASLLLLALPAHADADELAELLRFDRSARLGVLHVSDDNLRIGQYTGTTRAKSYALVDLDFTTRSEDGTWLRLDGRNLGLDSRELRAAWERQGLFGLSLDYSRMPRVEPLIIRTGLSGIGTASQTINGQALRDIGLSTDRERFILGLDGQFGKRVNVQLRVREETKEGARLFGRGTAQFLAEPIDSRTHQLEATIGYTGEQLQLVGGYYGSAFTNRNSFIDVATGTDIALSPDNESHQLHLSGTWRFTPSTRATFKVAMGTNRQNERFFIAPDFPGNTQTSLNGRVDTTSVQFGVSSRPVPELSLLANFRYDDRDDKTPRYQFLAASTGRDGFNTPFSRTTTSTRLEASYRLPSDFRLTGGFDVEQRRRSTLTIRQASWRTSNDESSYRLELRRTLGESLNGALSLVSSDRKGSDYLAANNNAAADLIDPIHFADRKRDRLRASLDWVPIEAVSLQFQFDEARDAYPGRPLGPEKGSARLWAVDGTWTLADDWLATGWVSNDDTRINQSTNTGANGATLPAQTWKARLRNRGEALGLGLRGRPSPKWDVGADLQYAVDRNRYQLTANAPAAAALPDIKSSRSTVKLFGSYALQKQLALRLELSHDRFRTDDWTWNGWTYADGTTVTLPGREKVTFIGVALAYSGW